MNTYDADTYYKEHYKGASADDWVEWYRQGAWPSAMSNRKLGEFDIADGHGVVYRMLDRFIPFNRVLDIGCSAGDFLIPIRNASKAAYGLDITAFPGAWEVLDEHFDIHCQQHDFDTGDLPFPDRHFSAVTMIMVLEHVFDVQHAAGEIARVLELGGIAIVQVPNIAYIKRRLDLLLGKLPITADASDGGFDKAWDGQHLHNFTLEALRALLLRNGLRIEDSRCFGRLASLRSLWPSLLGADITVLARRVE